jgi:hypothetical protein
VWDGLNDVAEIECSEDETRHAVRGRAALKQRGDDGDHLAAVLATWSNRRCRRPHLSAGVTNSIEQHAIRAEIEAWRGAIQAAGE